MSVMDVPRRPDHDDAHPLPVEFLDLLEKGDDLAIIADSFELIAQSGADLSTPEGQRFALEAGRRRARMIAEQAVTPPSPPPAPRQRPSWVYYLLNGDRVKIGYSVNPRGRCSTMGEQIAAVEPGARSQERVRHAQFAMDHVVGEWFMLSEKLRQHMERLRAAHPIPPRMEILAGRQGPAVAAPGLCTVAEIAELFGVKPGTVYSWCSRSDVPVYRRSGGVDADEVRAYLTGDSHHRRGVARAL